MKRLFTIALTLLLMSCATSTSQRAYTGPTDCEEVRQKLRAGDIEEFKGVGAQRVLADCVIVPGPG